MGRIRALLYLVPLSLAAGCGSMVQHTRAGAPGPTTTPTSLPAQPTSKPTPPATGPHFATPEAAMTYLADAWNRNDITSLKHVTDPAAREQLQAMHFEATNLKLDHCTFSKSRGDYECFFTHGFPKGYKPDVKGATQGSAEFTVGPADRPGWYMTYFIGCGG